MEQNMGVQYILVNFTKKEAIQFNRLDGTKARELTGNICSSLITWYMTKNIGDYISLVPDQYHEWPFPDFDDQVYLYNDVTEKLIDELIEKEVLKDFGILYQDSEDKDIYIRDIRNIWNSD